jgi:hypothetical protein
VCFLFHNFDFAPAKKVCPEEVGGKLVATLSLIPAFSPRRRRIFRRLIEKPVTGFAGWPFAKTKRTIAIPSPRGRRSG